jgi:1-acyl-sn-glycerol-3-phosphate acyltransferase
VPLVPVAIGGSRRVLRGDQWFPRRGAIHLHICAQLLAQGPGWLDAIKLRADARAALLQHLDEPDRPLLAG